MRAFPLLAPVLLMGAAAAERGKCRAKGSSYPTTTISYQAYPSYGTGLSTTVTTFSTTPVSSEAPTTTTSSSGVPAPTPDDTSACRNLIVPGTPTNPFIYTGGYVGYGNRTDPDANTHAPIRFYDGATTPVCTAAQQCAEYANNNGGTSTAFSFDLHKQLSTNQWVCVPYIMFEGAQNFTVIDPDVGSAYEYVFV